MQHESRSKLRQVWQAHAARPFKKSQRLLPAFSAIISHDIRDDQSERSLSTYTSNPVTASFAM
jgi:hypothetical protein